MSKLFKRIGMICLALAVAIGSFFVPISHSSSKSASADNTSYENLTFESSNIIYSCLGNSDNFNFTDFSGLLYANASNPITSLQWLNFSFRIISNFDSLSFYVYGSQGAGYGLVPSQGYNANNFYLTNTFNLDTSSLYLTNMYKSYFRVANSYYCTAIGTIVYHSQGLNSSSPNFEMYSLEIGNYTSFSYITDLDLSQFSNSNIVCYTDTNGYKYFYLIPLYQNLATNEYMYYDYRQYFYSNALDLTDSQLYNQGYQAGLGASQDGIYDTGYSDGYDMGLSRGKIIGASEANNYSFISLFGAIFDAPITMLMGLLNFNFLGINLWAFITSLFTLALVLFIIKLIMGR